MNVSFNYMYRDGANYKKFNSEIFTNDANILLSTIEEIITAALIENKWFYADKWNLSDLHLSKWDNEVDHNWHEYENVSETSNPATNEEDIKSFLEMILKTCNCLKNMSTSSEKNVISYTNENGFEFINAIPYLNDLLSKYPITLITSPITTNEILAYKFNERIVKCADEVLEWNLRAIDTFFPEVLLAFSAVTCNSLFDAVEELSKKGYPYPKKEYSVNFLRYKLYYFFKAILFEDFFNGVFTGKFTQKCYVTKEQGELQYYQSHNYGVLINKLLAKSSVTTIPYTEGDSAYYPLRFNFDL